jgi:ATP-dependent exoDNAse (exonuclease V) beta subunit
MINLIYVAFTRPAERLYIISREPGNGDANNLPNLLTQYIESTSDVWTSTGNVFSRGIDEHVKKVLKPMPEANLLSSMISSPWQGRIKIARRAPVYWSTDQSKNKQAWGTLIHDTLAAIRTKEDISDIVAKQALVNMLDEEQSDLLLNRVKATVNHELLKDYFSENVELKPESGILTPNGDVFRPDRVIFNKDETIILEFKTGLPKPGHEIQLNNYGEILLQMGYPGIKKLLVYLDETITVKNLNQGELF